MEQYKRLTALIGDDKFNNLKKLKVLIVGIGGVGGASLEMIVRSGIENITIIDFDTFEESNLNRQILSNINNIGNYKVNEAILRVKNINPNCNIIIYNQKLDDKLLEKLDIYDYVIDACDDIKAKILLIKYAIKNNIKIISSCGTGNKVHPEMLEITNIWKTSYDPLAKKLRYELRKEHINYKLPVVSSKEIPLVKSNLFVSSICTVPNAAGILLASWCINNYLKEIK